MNENTPQQSTAFSNQTPQTLKNSPNYWMFSTFLLLFLMAGAGLFAMNNTNFLAKNSKEAVDTKPSVTTTTPATNEASTKLSLSDTLVKFCINNKIPINKLPLSLNQKLLERYEVQNDLPCGPELTGFISLSKSFDPPEIFGHSKQVFIYTYTSLSDGQINNLAATSQYTQIQLNGKTYYLSFGEIDGGPGITSNRIVLGLIAQKTGNTDAIVRVRVNNFIKNPEALDLVKKYGSNEIQTDEPPGTYAITEKSTKRWEFIQDFVKLAPEMPEIVEMAKQAQADIDEVSY